jgi:hypothetical protein
LQKVFGGHVDERKDESAVGFFTDYVSAINNVWLTVNRLLLLGKEWEV